MNYVVKRIDAAYTAFRVAKLFRLLPMNLNKEFSDGWTF